MSIDWLAKMPFYSLVYSFIMKVSYILLGSLVFTSCLERPVLRDRPLCVQSSECEEGETCEEGECKQVVDHCAQSEQMTCECNTDQDCLPEQICLVEERRCSRPMCLTTIECPIGSVCEQYTCMIDLNADRDRDGIPDGTEDMPIDNCPEVVNPGQVNTDRDYEGRPSFPLGDEQGDACDVDDDNDGVNDQVDNCPRTYNPNQQDLDQDGLGDRCELGLLDQCGGCLVYELNQNILYCVSSCTNDDVDPESLCAPCPVDRVVTRGDEVTTICDCRNLDESTAVCGNGELEEGEECDDGNRNTEACMSDESCIVCGALCEEVPGKQPGELCDEGCVLRSINEVQSICNCGTEEVDPDPDPDPTPPCGNLCPEIEWIMIPGGTYPMGSLSSSGLVSQKEIGLSSFEIMKNEITVAQYRTCVDAGVCTPPGCIETTQRAGWLSCNFLNGPDNQPVNFVNWLQVRTFGTWVGADLPSESQWEFAARSRGLENNYPWGNDFPDCNRVVNGSSCELGTQEVCTHPEGHSEQGVCDLAGNVYEWVLDEYEMTLQNTPTDGTALCASENCEMNERTRVFRGGSWGNCSACIQNSFRDGNDVRLQADFLGGRLVRAVRP